MKLDLLSEVDLLNNNVNNNTQNNNNNKNLNQDLLTIPKERKSSKFDALLNLENFNCEKPSK